MWFAAGGRSLYAHSARGRSEEPPRVARERPVSEVVHWLASDRGWNVSSTCSRPGP